MARSDAVTLPSATRSALQGISVVIPCYNGRAYLGPTLDSVLAQTEPPDEILVVDDGSQDGSADWIEAHYPGVRVLRQPNQGVAAARNLGIRAASHDWIAFLDADDIWLPHKLAAQRRLLRAHPEARFCFTGWHVWPSTAQTPAPDWLFDAALDKGGGSAAQGPSGWIYPELLRDCWVWTSTVLADRALLLEAGGFEAGVPVGEDYALWLRAARLTPMPRVQQALALYRIHPASVTRSIARENFKARVIETALAQWGRRGPDGRSAPWAPIRQGLARSWADDAGLRLIAGQPTQATRSALRSLACWPLQTLAWTVLIKRLLRLPAR